MIKINKYNQTTLRENILFFPLILLLSLTCLITEAQDPQFSQFYANPYTLGPSFAGTTNGGRASLMYRNQWPDLPKQFVSSIFSVDYFLPNYQSGAGIFFMKDQAGEGSLSTTSFGLQYNYLIDINRFLTFRPGLQVSKNQRAVDVSKLTFVDQLSFSGNREVTSTNRVSEKIDYVDFSTSLLLMHPAFWVGFSINHLTTPNQSLFNEGQSTLPRKLKVYGGVKKYNRSWKKRRKDENFSFAFLYKSQANYDQLDIGLYWNVDPFILGLWYRGLPGIKSTDGKINQDAVVILVGVHRNSYKIGYSYDATISRLISNTGGAHEITFSYLFNQDAQKSKKRKRRVVSCPVI